jgi:hypothetical protein
MTFYFYHAFFFSAPARIFRGAYFQNFSVSDGVHLLFKGAPCSTIQDIQYCFGTREKCDTLFFKTY